MAIGARSRVAAGVLGGPGCRRRKPAHHLPKRRLAVRPAREARGREDVVGGRGATRATREEETSTTASSSIAEGGEQGAEEGGGSGSATALAGTGAAVLGIALLVGLGVVYKDDIYSSLVVFSALLEEWGSFGYLAYAGAYIVLEVLAVPAIPLTMTAGVLFGPLLGSVIVSISATIAATIAFLIARYVARDRVLEIAQKNEKFAAIDKAIGKESFKLVLFLRLSPLLPFALSNYLYGLTSVDLGSYVLGSWLGMFPGTFAYVSAGDVSKSVLEQTSGGGSGSLGSVAPLAIGVGGTLLATTFISNIVMKTLKELDIE
ncbi:TVP38/TMEM64 family membrane protein [Chloropicon primus]|uniref:VTT domain-containing protein n=2 Tax=Chloropicon primus TaxID=1764295 RepID=A0A5B8MW97_9CHLO|nr:hypothetical protein A3770_11p64230 [Chloropicon primus]UPR03116.1 TVP38/TMEM64 family membrane protein [Chloropicon primus]|eukprot:QDZ23905.1 hypothetical protein A3770_11p64230 [Chloropicon primus]